MMLPGATAMGAGGGGGGICANAGIVKESTRAPARIEITFRISSTSSFVRLAPEHVGRHPKNTNVRSKVPRGGERGWLPTPHDPPCKGRTPGPADVFPAPRARCGAGHRYPSHG